MGPPRMVVYAKMVKRTRGRHLPRFPANSRLPHPLSRDFRRKEWEDCRRPSSPEKEACVDLGASAPSSPDETRKRAGLQNRQAGRQEMQLILPTSEVPPHDGTPTHDRVAHENHARSKKREEKAGEAAHSCSGEFAHVFTEGDEEVELLDCPSKTDANPNPHTLAQKVSPASFNHYKKHTALKRRIFQMRKDAFQYYQYRWNNKGMDVMNEDHSRPSSSSSSPEENVEGNIRDGVSYPSSSHPLPVTLVEEMHTIYQGLDAAMQRRQYAKVHALKAAIRWRKKGLQKYLVTHQQWTRPPTHAPPTQFSSAERETARVGVRPLSLPTEWAPPPKAGESLPHRQGDEDAATEHPPLEGTRERRPSSSLAPSPSAPTATTTTAVYCSFFPDITRLSVPSPLPSGVPLLCGSASTSSPRPWDVQGKKREAGDRDDEGTSAIVVFPPREWFPVDQRTFRRYPQLLQCTAIEKLYRQRAIAAITTGEKRRMAMTTTAENKAGVPIQEGDSRRRSCSTGGGEKEVLLTAMPDVFADFFSSSPPPPSTTTVTLPLVSSLVQRELMWWEEGLQHAIASGAGEAKKGKKNIPSQPLKSPQPTPVPISPFMNRNKTNAITDALDDLAFTTLHYLYEEQRTLRRKHSLQFKSRQRYVIGFHEVLKWLRAGRLQMVLLASDIERWEEPRVGVEETTEKEGDGGGGGGAVLSSPPPSSASAVVPSSLPSQRSTFRSIGEAVDWIQAGCGIELQPERGGEGEKHDPARKKPDETDPNGGSGGQDERPILLSSPGRKKKISAVASDVEKEETYPLCITCLTRHSMAYALMCGGKAQVACVGIIQAEKYLYLVKALKAYGKALSAPSSCGPLKKVSGT